MISIIWWPHPLPTSNSVLEREEILQAHLCSVGTYLEHIVALCKRDLQRNKSILKNRFIVMRQDDSRVW